MDVYNLYTCDGYSTYTSLRSSIYRDYEKYPYGTIEGTGRTTKSYYDTVQEKQKKAKELNKSKKDNCPFCKDHKKRPLTSYIRKRGQDKKNNSICEEDEEDDHCHEPMPTTTAK